MSELIEKKIINGKKVTTFNLDVFEEALETGEVALKEALAILKTVNTPEAQAWVKKYETFAS